MIDLKHHLFEAQGQKLRSSRAESNWPLQATVARVGQNSSSVQLDAAYHVGTAVLAYVARSGQLDSALDERSFRAHFLFALQGIENKHDTTNNSPFSSTIASVDVINVKHDIGYRQKPVFCIKEEVI